jgi:hypothetical protein
MRKTFRTGLFATLVFILVTGLSPTYQVQASPNPASTPPPETTDPSLIPVTGSGKEQVIHDQVNTTTAEQKRAFGGEQFSVGKFERPFDKDMVYLPYLDIIKSTMQRADPNFIYTSIQVVAPLSDAEGKPAFYGLEMDTNLDGRSEYLILAEKPENSDWTVKGVNVWKSSSAEMAATNSGSSIPVTGSAGFDLNLFEAGKGSDTELALVRLAPDKPDTIEIAFKNTVVGGEKGKFVWRPLSDGASFSSRLYDLNVSFTLEQAGSPLKDNTNYPLKEVYAVDNTCRVASGYDATGNEPGICPLPPPPERPDRKSSPPTQNQQPPDLF